MFTLIIAAIIPTIISLRYLRCINPNYIIYGLIMSHYLYRYTQNNNDAYLIPALLLPILLHGIMDTSIAYKQYVVSLILPGLCIFIASKYVKRHAISLVPRAGESSDTSLEM